MKSISTEARMCLLNQAKCSLRFCAEEKPQILIQVWIEIVNLTFIESFWLEKSPRITEPPFNTPMKEKSCGETLFEGEKKMPWGHFYWFQVELCRLIMEEKIGTDSSMLTFKLVIRTKQAERDL